MRKILVSFLLIVLVFIFASCNSANDNEIYTKELEFIKTSNDTYGVACGEARHFSEIVIPEKYMGKPVTSIVANGFFDCTALKSIKVPNGITYIGNNAFEGCDSLESIVVPDSVTTIKSYAFADCIHLTDITISKNVAYIGANAFFNCPIEKVSIPVFAFSTISKSNLRSLTINAGESVDEISFSSCSKLETVEISAKITSIGASVFSDCQSLVSIKLPNSVTSIGNSAFYNCTSLTDIEIPDSVTSIAQYAFRDCSSLSAIVIPKSVISIGALAFFGCKNLEIYCEAKCALDNWDKDWNYGGYYYYHKVIWDHKSM